MRSVALFGALSRFTQERLSPSHAKKPPLGFRRLFMLYDNFADYMTHRPALRAFAGTLATDCRLYYQGSLVEGAGFEPATLML